MGIGLTGASAETIATEFLQQRGMTLMQRNYRCRWGEVDLIMLDGDILVFVEVRYRRQLKYGSGAETVTPYKQKRIIQTARSYIQRFAELPACRFDIVSITGSLKDGPVISCLPDAFQYC